MLKLILLGVVSGLFFSSTYILNEHMSNGGGHWFWSASLRYLFMLGLLTMMIWIRHGKQRIIDLIKLFKTHWQFWCVTGGIGFGLFYWGICYAADHASGWVVASTFMFTVVASLFVLSAFGQTFAKKVYVYAGMTFVGVLLVNISEMLSVKQVVAVNDQSYWHIILYGALPALVSAFCYPFGNQLVWQASQQSKNTDNQTNTAHASLLSRFIPTIQSNLIQDSFNKIWLMTLGSFPFWLVLFVLLQPTMPTTNQTINTFLVALFSGVIATSIFLYAREQAQTAQEVAGVDATQASEVIFSLVGGMLLFSNPLPSIYGLLGVSLIVVSLVLFTKAN